MPRTDPPCRHCEARSPVCHATCEAYRGWAAALQREKRETRDNASGRREAAERQIDACIAVKRRKHRYGR